jgi:hypothetical protein
MAAAASGTGASQRSIYFQMGPLIYISPFIFRYQFSDGPLTFISPFIPQTSPFTFRAVHLLSEQSVYFRRSDQEGEMRAEGVAPLLAAASGAENGPLKAVHFSRHMWPGISQLGAVASLRGLRLGVEAISRPGYGVVRTRPPPKVAWGTGVPLS